MRQGVHLPERRQHRGVLGAILDHAADVHVFDRGIGDFLWIVKLGELLQARLRNPRDSHVSGRAGRLLIELRPRQDFEQSSFSDLRKSDDPCLHRLQIVAYPCAQRLTSPASPTAWFKSGDYSIDSIESLLCQEQDGLWHEWTGHRFIRNSSFGI